ncbi:MAG: cytochrome c oxidase subunit 3 [Alphaproteobacteria bacterium]|nr:cytochrome c oxidase subunit 3 [Alphaproteobacteria bacterium]MBT5389399.1 cytochrome c oxidase subunit 3 [Alphaproteobacteria bacterium]
MAEKLKPHPYHMVDPSPWPFVGSIAALFIALGGALFMHQITIVPLLIGLGILVFTMIGWWRDVVNEAQTDEKHTYPVRIGLRYGMVFFIISELMLFASFFWAFFNASLFPTEATGGVWPPVGIDPFNPFRLPYLNTLLLLLSGTTITWAHHAMLENNRKDMVRGTGLTVLLGIVFLCVQIFEYAHAPFAFTGGIYPTLFYMATGFHGFHVFVGIVFLTVCFFRARKGHFKPNHHVGFEAAAWYWHFVDIIWLFLFVFVYWWGG